MAKLSEAAVAKINEICDRYVSEKTPLIMILSDIQNEYGYIPIEVQEIVSARTGISVAEIYGVVTFYSFFSLEPTGKYVIGCCLGTACYVKGAQGVIDTFCEELGIQPGQTTPDGMFTLDALRCLGGCVNGGGQPFVRHCFLPNEDPDILDTYIEKRAQALYSEDERSTIRLSYKNTQVQKLYEDFLGEPNSHKAHELLHTTYVGRDPFRD